jgi:formylglycine-generating enzyme required for sulfatase activity/serine/threonine protein kinase
MEDVSAEIDVSLGGGRTGAGSAAGVERISGPGDLDYAARHLGPGSVLAGRYEVEDLIGAGGMGAVYRVRDRVRGAEVALKVMLPSLMARPRAVERFSHEAEVSLGLAHEHIVRVFDVNEDPALGVRFYTMELLQGVSLRVWIEEKRKMHSEVTVEEALTIVEQILEALRYAHRTTVHRDLKPENVFILFGNEIRVKILDFGLAKLRSGTGFTQTSVALGTAYYMAPEQQTDAASVDARADLYSVAVILYELLTGRLPIGRFRLPSAERKALPRALDEILARGLEADPARRFASADEFLAALRSVRAPGGGKAGPRRKGGAGILVLWILLLGGAGGAWVAGVIPPLPGFLNPFGRPEKPSREPTPREMPPEAPDGAGGTTGGGSGSTSLSGSTGGSTGGAGETIGGAAATTGGTGGTSATTATTGGTTGVLAPLAIEISSPKDGEVTAETSIAVTGELKGGGRLERVLVAGVEAVLDQSGSFRGRAPLDADGEQRIEVTARDAAGSEARKSVRVVRDIVPPVLDVLSPPPGAVRRTSSREISVEGIMRDANPRRLATGSGIEVPVGPDGRFAYRWRLGDEGPNQLVLVATDLAGNDRRATVEAILDTTPPRIEVELPAEDFEAGAPVTIAGSVGELCSEVRVGGEPAVLSGTRFSRTFILPPGKHTIEVVAVDEAGNKGRATVEVSVAAPPGPAEPEGNHNLPFPVRGLEPAPTPGEFRCVKDGSIMLFVPAGTFEMGAETGADDEKPIHEVELGPYYIDKTEVTVGQFARFVRETSYVTDAERAGDAYVFEVGKGFVRSRGRSWRDPGYSQTDSYPVVCVSWRDAAAYARWAGKRLPTEAEWERAAGWEAGPRVKRAYAWGNDYPPHGRVANIADRQASRALSLPRGAAATEYDDGFIFAAPVGSFPEGRSPVGALDMSGNVWEWCADWYSERFYATAAAKRRPAGPEAGSERVYRGGSWSSPLGLRTTARASFDPSYRYSNLGFRCVKSE